MFNRLNIHRGSHLSSSLVKGTSLSSWLLVGEFLGLPVAFTNFFFTFRGYRTNKTNLWISLSRNVGGFQHLPRLSSSPSALTILSFLIQLGWTFHDSSERPLVTCPSSSLEMTTSLTVVEYWHQQTAQYFYSWDQTQRSESRSWLLSTNSSQKTLSNFKIA